MTYVISDIHGEFFKFQKMLELIEFKESDEMYILGDAVDRGKYPIRTLLYIIDHSNMKMLVGNHEVMMMKSDEDDYFKCWMNNGGDITLSQYSNLCKDDRDKIDVYLDSLPILYELDKYILVHAGITKDRQDDDFLLWAREDFLNVPTGLDKTVIFGHTPTVFMTGNRDMKIWYNDGRIDIDCGSCFTGGKLACLRLDDMKEFYV